MNPDLTIQIKSKLNVLVSTRNMYYSKGCKEYNGQNPYALQDGIKLNYFGNKYFNKTSLTWMDFNYVPRVPGAPIYSSLPLEILWEKV